MLPRRFDTLLHCFCWTLFTWNLQPRGNSTFSRNVIMRQVQPSSQKWGEATLGQWLWQIHCQSQLLTLLLVQVWRWASPSSSLQMPGPSYSWRASQPGLPELHKDSTNSIGLWNWKLKAIENRGQCNLVSEEDTKQSSPTQVTNCIWCEVCFSTFKVTAILMFSILTLNDIQKTYEQPISNTKSTCEEKTCWRKITYVELGPFKHYAYGRHA